MAHKKQEKLVFDTLTEEQKDFFIQSLEKKVRNLNKKLKEIVQLEKDRKEGKELKETQISKIASKDEHNSKKKELDNIARLYLEAKAEALSEKKEGETVVEATSVPSDAVAQLTNLFFAAQHAYQTNSNADLAVYFTTVFNNVSATRVATATAELTAYLAGHNPAIQAQVVQVVASESFNAESAFHTKDQTTEAQVEEPEVVEEPVQVEEPVVVHHHHHEVVHHVHHHEAAHHVHHHEVKEQVVEAEHVEHKEVAEEPATEQAQGETTTAEGEAPKEHNGEKKYGKKPYVKRTNSNGGQRKPREPRGDGENTQQAGENGEHKRGHRQHHNGPRHGGNRSGNKRQDGENTQNENQNDANVVNDGWNVVTKGPSKPEYKPRTREGGNHHHNKERPQGEGHKRVDGQKPNHSGNRRPFNKDRPQGEHGQNQYVRKEKPATEAPEQATQN